MNKNDILLKVKSSISDYLRFDVDDLFLKSMRYANFNNGDPFNSMCRVVDDAYIFGGAIRDSLADVPIKDIDIIGRAESLSQIANFLNHHHGFELNNDYIKRFKQINESDSIRLNRAIKLFNLSKNINISDLQKLTYKSFTIYFNNKIELPVKSVYYFKNYYAINNFKRTSFIKDPNKKNQLTSSDYSKISYSYDKGHLVPNDDMGFDSLSQIQSMYYTNCAPQISTLNRGVWKQLENVIKLKGKYLPVNDSIYVETGILFKENITIINNIYIPDYFYKIIKYKNSKDCYILNNIQNNPKKKYYQLKCDCKYLDSLIYLNKTYTF